MRDLLDGSATFVFFAAIIYSVAVSVAIYAFWSFMLRFVPLVTSGVQRVGLFVTMAIGCLMIMAMSAWLNAAALAGSAALEQHLAVNLQGYVADLDDAHGNALAAQSLLPDVQRAAERFSRLAEDERESGVADRHHRLGLGGPAADPDVGADDRARQNTITGSRDEVQALFEQGSAHLAKMRELVSGARRHQAARRRVLRRSRPAHRRDLGAAGDRRRALGEARRAGPVARLHRPGRRWRQTPASCSGRTR